MEDLNMKKTIISAASLTALSAIAAANISASEVTVESGDTLWSISEGSSQSVNEIKSLNNLTSELIFPGDVLKVDAEAPNAAPAEEVKTEESASTYTIEAGDTLFAIASQFDVAMDDLKAWNNLSSDLIIAGKTIVVAEEAAAPAAETVEESAPAQETAAPAVEEVEVQEVEAAEAPAEAAPAVEEVEEVEVQEEVEEVEEVEQPAAAPAAEPAVTGGNAAAVANSLAVGKSYVYGGNSATAVDCSSFAQQFMAAFNGKSIPRDTYGQKAAGTQVSNPQPGDLVFFNN